MKLFIMVLFITCLIVAGATAAPIHRISVDGLFEDWVDVPMHMDPADDTHDTDHDQPDDTPVYVNHPDVDLLEYKLTHDEYNLYAYFRATGKIGRTQSQSQGRAGRYYVIVTIDVDDDTATGYWLHEGGYFPTSSGYDMNMEVEFYDGAFNTGHYLNHGCRNEQEFQQALVDQAAGIVRVLPGTYDWYTQWVYWDEPQGLPGEITLPDGASIMWVTDRGPVYQGIIRIAVCPDGHQAEMVAPFRGFMKDPEGDPIVALGNTINVSFSLEASGELAPDQKWASDTADPLVGYLLEDRPLDAVWADYNNGSDSTGHGLWENPFKTLARALDSVADGGVVQLLSDEPLMAPLRIGDDNRQVLISAASEPVRIGDLPH